MEDLTKYNLTEEEYQRCLKTAEMGVFMNTQSAKEPKSIFIVAQPGAGKSGLKAGAINAAQDSGKMGKYIEFNPDEISVYHKHYVEIIENCPDESHKILQKFTQRALDTYLRQRAVEVRCNIVQEGTFRSDGYIDILDFQKNGGKLEKKVGESTTVKEIKGGYNIEIDILAVTRYESLLSCFEREQYFLENELPPRAVTIDNHDESYEKMLKTIDKIEQRKLYNEMKVYRRGYIEDKPELIYMAGDKKFPSTSEAIRHERHVQERALLNHPEEYLKRIEKLKEKVLKTDNKSLLTRLEYLERDFLNNLEQFKRIK